MRIENLYRQHVGDRTRIGARITYEDADLPPLDVYYEAGPPLADALEATPEAFVPAAFPIALWAGERRLQVEGSLDTTLAAGLRQVEALLAFWYERCGSLNLEPLKGFRAVRPRSEPCSVALFSGGVDAMAMLRENRQLVPLDHPHSIRTVVHAFGYARTDRPKGVESPLRRARYEAYHRRLTAMGERAGFTVARLDTNVMRLYPELTAYYEAAFSGAFLAPLLASPRLVTDALIASAGEGAGVRTPHGSHPMLDSLYSTSGVRVHHMQPHLSRLDKIGLIADWEPAYDTLMVCFPYGNEYSPELINCGKCEKCVRTMLGLTVWKALPRFTTFEDDDVTPEMIDAIKVKAPYCMITAPDLLDGLRRVGRDDLVRRIEVQVEQMRERQWARRRGKWRRRIAKGLGRLPVHRK